jgi:hypothetical protein
VLLKWVRAQDPPCPWDERTCAYAAKQVWSLECVVGAGPSSRPSLFVLGMREHVHMLLSKYGHLNVLLERARAQDPPCLSLG